MEPKTEEKSDPAMTTLPIEEDSMQMETSRVTPRTPPNTSRAELLRASSGAPSSRSGAGAGSSPGIVPPKPPPPPPPPTITERARRWAIPLLVLLCIAPIVWMLAR